MAHLRSRHIEQRLKKALTYAPCIGLLGMRQTGKSTLLKMFSKEYYSFDNEGLISRFEREGSEILSLAPNPLGLDEVQKYPPIFDQLKLSVDRVKKPGRFLLSGSVRFSSRQQIRESLTGRIVLLELFPMTLAECHHKPLSIFLKLFHEKTPQEKLIDLLKKRSWASEEKIDHYQKTGGLPGICFRREESVRFDFYSSHLETLLGRDIQLIRKIQLSVSKLISLLTEIAKRQGLPINFSELARIVGTSIPTVKSALDVMEGVFLIRPYGDTWFLEDSGLSHFLAPQKDIANQTTRWEMLKLCYLELRAQVSYGLKHEVGMKPYKTRGGIDIPFLIESKSGERLAIVIEEENLPSNKALKSLSWFGKHSKNTTPLILLNSHKPFISSTGILCLPWTWVF
ncbi:MAG: ATP-binding protein [Deltaproteobacteria bacterium]|nr:MAG: ATP-binding protein [Deltaproteobacteria bacterium]